MESKFKEAIELLEAGCEVVLKSNGYSYEVSPSDNWIGGEEMGGFISQVLGNIVYDDAEHVLKESIDFLAEDGKEVKITF